MAFGALSSLGIGSNVLTYDVIDKLKAQDKKVQIDPLDRKIEKNMVMQKDLTAIAGLVSSFKSNVSSLGDETFYLSKKVVHNGKSAYVTADDGVLTQNFSLDVEQLATKDIHQSKKFKSEFDFISNSKNAAIKLKIDQEEIEINITSTMTLQDLAHEINDKARDHITAKVLNVGGEEPFQLILQSKKTGEKNAIKILPVDNSDNDTKEILNILGFLETKPLMARNIQTSNAFKEETQVISNINAGDIVLKIGDNSHKIKITPLMTLKDLADEINSKTNGEITATIKNIGGDNPYKLVLEPKNLDPKKLIEILPSDSNNKDNIEVLNMLGFMEASSKVLSAQDAKFKYDGIDIIRSENQINDISVGVSIKLQETGKTDVSINNNNDNLIDSIKDMIKAYNELINNLNAATNYDQESNIAGTFQGSSEIRSITSSINKILLSSNNGQKYLVNYGIELNKDGLLIFNEAKFSSKLNEHPDEIKEFFSGNTTYNKINYISKKPVISGGFEIKNNDFIINDVEISFKTNDSNDSKANAQALLQAINEAKILGIYAKLTENKDKVISSSDNGQNIVIDGNQEALSKFGFDKTTITSKINKQEGIFSSLNNVLESISGGSDSKLVSFEKNLINEKDSLTKEKAKTAKMIFDRYQIMAERFAAYDTIIAKMNNQFKTLQSMIDAQLHSKK